MAVTHLHPEPTRSNTVTLTSIGDRLHMVRDLVEAVYMMASDLEEEDQRSAFVRMAETIKGQIRSVETDLDAIRAGAVQ